MSIKDDQLILRCFKCKMNSKKDFNIRLINRFSRLYTFCDEDVNKFILLLKKGVYPYKYMDSWERFDETSLPNKEDFYSSLNIEDVTDIDYRHAKRVFKTFNNKNICNCHDLYVESDTLLLADVFENSKNISFKEYELNPAQFFICSWISIASLLKIDMKKIRITYR